MEECKGSYVGTSTKSFGRRAEWAQATFVIGLWLCGQSHEIAYTHASFFVGGSVVG
jgi:hypothetical protein